MDEEISSDSENERYCSLLCWMNADVMLIFLKNQIKSPMSFLCSADPSRKQQENEDDEIEETPQEKKLRLAKLYLEQLREEGV